MFSIWHWLIFLIIFAAIPIWGWSSIARKAGYSGWWALLSIIPLVNLVVLYIFAYSTWPIDERPGALS